MKFLIALSWFLLFGCVFMVYTEIKNERRFPWFSFFFVTLLFTLVLAVAFH